MNEYLIVQVCGLTDNFFGVVKSLFVNYVEHEHRQRLAKTGALAATMSMWNAPNARRGTFAEEHSSP